MSVRLNFDSFINLFQSKDYIELSDRVYAEKTGHKLPSSLKYLKYSSPFSRWLREMNFVIVEIKERTVVEKVVCIKRKKG